MNKFLWVKWLVRRLLSIPLALFHPGSSGIRILMYHRVTDEGKQELAVSKEGFLQQMQYLAQKARVISLAEAVKLLQGNKRLTDSYVVLTFDDGYDDIYHTVYPILYGLNLPATAFVAAGYISRKRVFWWDEDVGYSNTLTLSQIREMYQTGIIDFQSHTIEHLDLDGVDNTTQDEEIIASKQVLAQLLDKEISYFAYPRGLFNTRAVKLVGQHYQAAVSTILGTNQPGINLALLRRIPIDYCDDMTIFKLKISGKFEVLYRIYKRPAVNWLWGKMKHMLNK